MARGYPPQEGIDCDGTIGLAARYTSIRALMALAAKMKWKLHQMDVKIAFLNGIIEEEVYIDQPQGFDAKDPSTRVCRKICMV